LHTVDFTSNIGTLDMLIQWLQEVTWWFIWTRCTCYAICVV